jgi:hypothetical protein
VDRLPIKKSVRFEVFKRDGFACQYCGAKSPDVILHIDHINPVSKGGDNEIINLVTACCDCNLGKSDRLLGDKASIERQRAQLAELSERREQLEMMLQWRDELVNLDEDMVDAVIERIERLMEGNSVNEKGRDSVRKWLKKFSLDEVLDAADLSAQKPMDDLERFFWSIPKICATKRMPEQEQRLRYARGILRNRLSYINESLSLDLMKGAVAVGADPEDIIEFSKTVKSWTAFRKEMEGMINA